MIDFLMISTRSGKRGTIEIYPKFIVKKSSDLMIRGGDFYAIWLEENGLWSTDEQDALQLIDHELDLYYEKNKNSFDGHVKIMHMWDAESGMIDVWHKYCQKQMRDSFHMLDEKLIFSNTVTTQRDYASKKLNYPLEKGKCEAYEKLISTLYSKEERDKIEWAIGSIVCGDSKIIQKFLVLYGAAGTGKSTILNIIQKLFEGYYSVFDAKALGSSSNSFALEAFKTNPLVAIQHDGDLSRIEDNTRLNSLVSHELMTVNEKFKSTYSNRFKCFLFMGTNKPVKITDGRSGLIRRLIDVSPSGKKLSNSEYRKAVKQINFELGAIAYHCQEVYLNNPNKYDDYIPISMLGASNDFYNFMLDSYLVFKRDNGTTLKSAWEMYRTYCEDAKVPYPFSQRMFKEELKNYFDIFELRHTFSDGSRARSYYEGFRIDKFEETTNENNIIEPDLIDFNSTKSLLDDILKDNLAQYANNDGKPISKWDRVKTKLMALDTSKLHFVKPPENHIVIDFDIPDETGNKNYDLNLKEASKFPPTYAELSKSGKGIHLHYIYNGDVSKLSRIYDEHIEIKVFNGKSSLRRKLTKCNDIPIATISSGLPLKKGEKKLISLCEIKSEKDLRKRILRNLNKEIHEYTKPSVDFIYTILEEAYNSGLRYDVTDMKASVLAFAAESTNQSDYCIKLVNKMKFKSDEPIETIKNHDEKLVFFDVEVFPNLFLVNWKTEGPDKSVVRMINPTPHEIEELIKLPLVGFNNRRYDNHMLYARLMGYSNEQLYKLSHRIIKGEDKNCLFGEAYNLSYTDIYDFSSKKQSLKKFEIELGIHHQELGLPWDEPVPEELWDKVAEYCDNDVIATEAVFNDRKADFTARKILADVAGMTVNDTTNSLTTKIIFGSNRKPQTQFNYRNMGDTRNADTFTITNDLTLYSNNGQFSNPDYTLFNMDDGYSKPVFPGYEYKYDKDSKSFVSTYRGEIVGEGGYVYAEPGMYSNVALLDIASMHPSSIVAENLFGDEYTRRYKDILEARIAIKHKDFDKAKSMLGGKLAKYLDDEGAASDLAQALKIAINSVYGLTMTKFENPFRDPRNKDNIVAKRGALFMINLKHEVQARGFTVAHIKTDSIKIPNATKEIIDFVMDYGSMYGYTFEHEATYDRMCLVNDTVYIAKYNNGEWTATGTQFAVPYVFKTLFSKEPITFDDMCETKSVTTSLYLDMNESLPNVEILENELDKLLKKQKKDPDNIVIIERIKELKEEIAKGHNYIFVGRVGRFCPIIPGKKGGLLVRESINKQTGEKKFTSATGSKGYRWLEAEMMTEEQKLIAIDKTYYDTLVTDAVNTISEYGDFEWFASVDGKEEKTYEDIPPWEVDIRTILPDDTFDKR